MRKLILIFALACLSAIAADPEVSFLTAARLGQLKLEPGLYKVKVIGAFAIFTDAAGKSYSTLTRLEKSTTSTFTAVLGTTADGVQRVDTIVLAGSASRLTFSK